MTTYVATDGLTTYIVSIEIGDSARKHQISDEDILHAARNPVAFISISEDRAFFIGAAPDGGFLEIVVIDPDGEPAVIHADVCRPKFFRYLI
ncbi:MAG: hypothetical protein ACRDZ3_06500 [Acidimicrobiia bacterium]